MASVYSDYYSTGTYTKTRVRVDYSDTSATAYLLYTRTNTYSGATSSGTSTFTFGGQSVDMSGVTFYGQQTDAVVCSVSFTISTSGGTYSGSTSGSPGLLAFSGSVDIPAQYTSPSITSITLNSVGTDSANLTIVGDYGTGTGSYQIEVGLVDGNVWSSSNNLRTQAVTDGRTTYTTTINNSSTTTTTLTIEPNTQYYYGGYIYNGYNSARSVPGTCVTLAEASSVSVDSYNSTSATIAYTTTADGGYYDKYIQYSIDGGTTWTTGATVSSGSVASGTYTISGLSPNTVYTIQTRVTTTAGSTTGLTLTVTTMGVETPTISVSNESYDENDVTYGTTSFGGGSNPAIYLYGGTSSSPTAVVDSDSSTGDISFNHTGLTGNTTYYYLARGYAEFDGTGVWSEYSDEVSTTTICPAPTITAGVVLEYETATTVTVRLAISIVADGNAYDKDVQYRYSTDGGSAYTSWVSGATLSSGSATSINIDVTGLPTSTTILFMTRSSTTAGVSESSATYSVTTSGTHEPPTDFDYSLADGNTTLQTWLSSVSGYTNPIYVQGQSEVQAVVPESTKGTCSDGASVAKYIHILAVDSNTKTTTDLSYPITVDFGTSTPENRATDYASNTVIVRGSVYDTLDTYTEIDKTVISLSWESPTISISGERLAGLGTARIDYNGTYARLQDDSLNSGDDINTVEIAYRVLGLNGDVVIDWTTVSGYTVSVNTDEPFLNDVSGRASLTGIPSGSECVVEMKITDHFESATDSINLPVWSNAQINNPAEYEIELWDWKTNSFVADLSYLVVGDLDITWELNDVEELSFSIDLLEFENKCDEMGVDAKELLAPYAHDIRVRRNGEYILGCQLVEAQIQLTNNPPAKINLKCTGFLNLLKDQYIIDETWSGYTYAEIARKLVERAQQPDCLVKNPTGDIDISYWLAANGTAASSTASYEGDRCIAGSRSGTGWITLGTQMNCDSGENVIVDAWIKGQNGIICQVRERQYITQSSNQVVIANFTLNGSWQHIQVPYQTFFEDGYIIIEMNRTDSSTLLYVDNCYVYPQNDDANLCNLGITLGDDTASATQDDTRQFSYELQNVKDALMNLVEMEDDNFDFSFDYDRTFNCYSRKGSDKLDLEVCYPGNIESMNITRSASNLANKVYGIGSGIGDERLQTMMTNLPSRKTYGTRESINTDSNIELESTLATKTIGNLYDRKDPTNLPTVTISDGSINPANVEVGDTLLVTAQMDDYLESINGEYRIMKIKLTVSEDAVEKMQLTFDEPLVRPEKKMVRYIRDTIVGSSANYGKHWVEIQALMLVGNDYVNVAEGATVYGSASFVSSRAGTYAVDGDTSTYAAIDGSSYARAGVTVDLGDEYPIDYVKIWHYYSDGRIYYGNHLSVGTELPDSTTGTGDLGTVLWSYGTSSGYVETSSGKRSKWLQEGEINGDSSSVKVRYIRESCLNNSSNYTSLWSEIKAYIKDDGGNLENIAPNGTVYCSGTPRSGTYTTYVNDNNTSTYLAVDNTETTRNAITIDLGAEYPLEYIQLWHYIDGNRTFYGSQLSVGASLPDSTTGTENLDIVLWADGDNEGIVETSVGRRSVWIQGMST